MKIANAFTAVLSLNGVLRPGRQERPQQPKIASEVSSGRDFTLRQCDILCCILRGLSNEEIAKKLDINEGTVKIHLAALFARFGARNRTDLSNRAQGIAHQGAASNPVFTDCSSAALAILNHTTRDLAFFCPS